jgi:predicted transcriptional regulator of viral defense system
LALAQIRGDGTEPEGSDDRDVSLSHNLAEMAVRVPKGIICLISALAHHGITLQNPRAVWMAIGPEDRKPSIAHRAVRFVHFGEAALQENVQRVDIDGVAVLIFSPAKTIVDCFRYRRIVGLDVALEALRVGMRSGKARSADIARLAKSLRIWSVLRPNLEAVTADDT